MKSTDGKAPARTCTTAQESCSEFEEAADLFKSLSDAARLAILRHLRVHGETCACDFSGCCGLTQPTMSYHLKALRESGLVETDKRGSWVYYRLNVAKMDALRDLLP